MKSNSLTLKLLRAFFTLGHTTPAEDAPDPALDDPAAVDPPADDPALDEIEDVEAPAIGDPDPDDPATIKAQLAAEKKARETAERNHREASDRLAALERQRQPAAGPTEEQRLFDQEEAILRDPKSNEQQRYWVNANRTLRANQRDSQQALRTSQEMADQTAYDRLSATSPVAKKYADRVEKKLAEIRADGKDLPRIIVLKLLIGDDYVGGKVKSKKPAADPQPPPQGKQVARGAPAVSRGDVRARGNANSERDKRRARLDGQIL